MTITDKPFTIIVVNNLSIQDLKSRTIQPNNLKKLFFVIHDDEKLPEGFSSNKYVPGSGLAMMVEIVEEPECVSEVNEVS
ncbi:hypothetical protein Hanom_Chr01g00076181 [Helianthus anomalus]